MNNTNRRGFLKFSVRGVLFLTLFRTLVGNHLLASDQSYEIIEWINKLNDLAYALKTGQINVLEWQHNMDVLYREVNIDTLLKQIDFNKVIHSPEFDFNDTSEKFLEVPFLAHPGIPENMNVITKIAKVMKGKSIPPHGHINMTSAFLTLSGEFHVRQFDRLYYDDNFFYIRSISDHYSRRGHWNSQSDYRTNVHWLTAMTDDTYLFSVKLIKIDPNKRYSSRHCIDPNGKQLGGDIIKAERISPERAFDLFG